MRTVGTTRPNPFVAALAALVLAVSALALAAAPAAASTSPPTGNVVIDPSFTGGSDFPVLSIGRQSDGKILIFGRAARTWDARLTRLLPTGEPDPSFIEPTLEGSLWNTWLTVQPDDKVLISGQVTGVNGHTRPGLARLNPDGSLDKGFAPIVAGTDVFTATGPATVQPDGKILVSGELFDPYADPYIAPQRTPVIARFTRAGNHDTTFQATLGSGEYGNAYARTTLQPDGKIIVSGAFRSVNGADRNGIARIDATGAVDPTFDPGRGFAARPCPLCGMLPGTGPETVALQPDGKIVVGGTFQLFNWANTPPLIRLNADGTRDASFNTGTGMTLMGKSGPVPSGAADGQQDPAVSAEAGGTTSAQPPSSADLVAEAMLPTTSESVLALALQPDGKVVIGGVFGSYRGTQRHGLARVNPNGSMDLTFDTGAGLYGSARPELAFGAGAYALAPITGGGLLVGGNFTAYDQQPAANLALLTERPQQPGAFTPLATPVRVFDSRIDPGEPFYGTEPVDVTRGGTVELPEGTSAVAVNVTITGQTASGYASLARDDGRWYPPSCPLTSAVNWSGPRQTIANAITVGISGEGKLKICVMGNGQAHVIIDLMGYYAPEAGSSAQAAGTSGAAATGALFVPLAPVRAYDSRTTGGPLAGGTHRTLDLAAGAPGAIPPGATAVAYNLTATGTTTSGYLAIAPGGTTTPPGTSTLNWPGPNTTIANAAQTGLTNRTLEIFAGGTGTTHAIVDIVGYYAPPDALPDGTQGLAFLPIPPTRAYDSRTTDGPLAGNPTTGAPGTGRTTSVTLGGALPANTGAIAANLTATGTTGSGYLTTSPTTGAPATSIINWPAPNTTIANATPTGTSPTGELTTWIGGRHTSHYLIDLTGYYVPTN